MSTQESNNTHGQTALGFLLLTVIVIFIVWALASLYKLLSGWISDFIKVLPTMDAAIVVALITSCVSIITVVGGAILKEYLSYRYKKLEFLRDRREKPYRKLIEINFKMLQKTNSGEKYSPDEMMADFYEFGQELTLWGSAKAIRLWDDWRLAPNKGKADGKELLLLMEKIIIQLRKNMGQGGRMAEGDILKLYINDFDEAMKKAK